MVVTRQLRWLSVMSFILILVGMLYCVSVLMDFWGALNPEVLKTAVTGLGWVNQVHDWGNLLVFTLLLLLMSQALIWIICAYAALEGLNNRELNYGPKSIVIFLFIPGLNIVHVLAVLQEVWRGSDPESILTDELGWANSQPSRLITIWWSVLILGLMLLAIAAMPSVGTWLATSLGLNPPVPKRIWIGLFTLAQVIGTLLFALISFRVLNRLRRRYRAVLTLSARTSDLTQSPQVIDLSSRRRRSSRALPWMGIGIAIALGTFIVINTAGLSWDYQNLLNEFRQLGQHQRATARSETNTPVDTSGYSQSQSTHALPTVISPSQTGTPATQEQAKGKLIIFSQPVSDLGFTFTPYVTSEGFLGIRGQVLSASPKTSVMAWSDQDPPVRVSGVVATDGNFELVIPLPGPTTHTVYVGTSTGGGSYASRGSVKVHQLASMPNTYDTSGRRPDGIKITRASYSAGIRVKLRLDAQGFTIVEGRFPVDSPWTSVMVWDEKNSFTAVTARIKEGRFSARVRLMGGNQYNLLIGGTAANDSGGIKYHSSASLDVQLPRAVNPSLVSSNGIVVLEALMDEDGITLEPQVTSDGQLLINLVIDPSVGYSEFLFFAAEGSAHQFQVRSITEAGKSLVTFPLPGPAMHTILVGRKVDNSHFRSIGKLLVQQTRSEDRTPARVFSGRLQLDSTISSGSSFVDKVPISGRVIGGMAYDPLVIVTIRKESESGTLEARDALPVINGSFSGEVWLRFGPGLYSLELGVPSGPFQWSTAVEMSVRNSSAKDHRYLAPSKGIESTDQRIAALSTSITGGLQTDLQKTVAIHDWVAKNIAYDVIKLRDGTFRLSDGAVATLISRKGVCSDYAKLTVALLRSSEIPSRIAVGRADGYGGWGLHAWVEAYVDGRWIAMDPTWNAGFLREGQFVPSFTHRFFNPSPQVFSRSHILTGYEY